jgi:hypothetical protein
MTPLPLDMQPLSASKLSGATPVDKYIPIIPEILIFFFVPPIMSAIFLLFLMLS